MQVREYLAIVRKRWLLVLLFSLLGAGIAATASFTATPLYQAGSSVYFSLPFGNTANDLSQGSNYTQNQMLSYATLATMPAVLDPVISQLSLDTTSARLASAINATASNETVIIDIEVTDTSPQEAADIANAVASELGTVVKSLAPKGTTGQASIEARTVATASPPASPSSPNIKRNIAIGLFAGFFAGVLLAILRELLDNTIRTAPMLRSQSDSAVLGVIPFDKSAKSSPLIAGGQARSISAEAFRQLRTNLQFLDIENPARVVVVTSSAAGEGKSTTAVNLAVSFSESGRRVLLIEGDLRRPRVSDYLGLERAVGLTNVLAGQMSIGDALQTWGEGLTVLPSGSIPPNPSELLGGSVMNDLLSRLKAMFDMIIIDTPPLLPVTDAAVAAKLADGVVVIVRAGKTTKAQLHTSLRNLEDVDARVFGTVLNMVPTKGADSYAHYGYGYGYVSDPAAAALLPMDLPAITEVQASERIPDADPESGARPAVFASGRRRTVRLRPTAAESVDHQVPSSGPMPRAMAPRQTDELNR